MAVEYTLLTTGDKPQTIWPTSRPKSTLRKWTFWGKTFPRAEVGVEVADEEQDVLLTPLYNHCYKRQ